MPGTFLEASHLQCFATLMAKSSHLVRVHVSYVTIRMDATSAQGLAAARLGVVTN